MSKKLVYVTRGNVIECIHRGDIAVVNASGEILYGIGNPKKKTYFRSAAKPLQAINVLLSGAFQRYHLTNKELALICSSHYAEPHHINAVKSILDKIGLNENHILGGTVTSLSYDYALELARKQTRLNPMYSDCSGKHAGMLAACQHKNYPVVSYLLPEHPVQKDILNIISEICEVPAKKIGIGIDGCSAPVHAMPLYKMALGYAKLSNPDFLPPKYQEPAKKIFHSMITYPEMISGTNGFCSAFIAETNQRMIGKVGAEGVYCVGIKNQGLGIAVKIENGNMKMLSPVVIEVLKQLELLSPEELDKLLSWYYMDNTNDIGTVVGKIYPDFKIL